MVWKIVVRHEARVPLLSIVALGAVGPSIGKALSGPQIMDVFSQLFGQCVQLGG